jgi:hypothetical protein
MPMIYLCFALAVAICSRSSGTTVSACRFTQSDGSTAASALSPAAAVGDAPVMDHRPCRCLGKAIAGLSLSIAHWFVAEGSAGHGCAPKRYVTE